MAQNSSPILCSLPSVPRVAVRILVGAVIVVLIPFVSVDIVNHVILDPAPVLYAATGMLLTTLLFGVDL